MAKNENIVQEIADLIGEPPEKWQPQWKAMPKWGQHIILNNANSWLLHADSQQIKAMMTIQHTLWNNG